MAGKSAGNRKRYDSRTGIVIIGKTGNGKSSLGNIILGSDASENLFPVGSGLTSATTVIKSISTDKEDKTIEVIDVPDFTNLDSSHDDVGSRVTAWKTDASNKLYVVLLAIRCDVRYTKEEYDIYLDFKRLWGESMCDHLLVAFTFGDRLDHKIEKDLKGGGPHLQSVLKDARKRYLVFNDKDSKTGKKGQIQQLMAKIHKMQKKNTRMGCSEGDGLCCTIL